MNLNSYELNFHKQVLYVLIFTYHISLGI